MQMTNLEDLIGAEHTADWRRDKAEEFPDDSRNAEAAESLGKIAEGLKSLNNTELHKRAWNALEKNPETFGEILNEELRQVGFTSGLSNAREFVEHLCDQVEARQ